MVELNVPSTARSYRYHIYCPLRRTWSSVFTPFPSGIEHRAVAWQSITQPNYDIWPETTTTTTTKTTTVKTPISNDDDCNNTCNNYVLQIEHLKTFWLIVLQFIAITFTLNIAWFLNKKVSIRFDSILCLFWLQFVFFDSFVKRT